MTSIRSLKLDGLIGLEVGTSTLLRELARGGMAAIFIAYQRTLKRQIAVKILPKLLLTPLAAKLFQQEAEAAAILSHPNIVPVYEVGEARDFLFITMQLVKGRSLFDYMNLARNHVLPSRRILPVETTIKIVSDVLDALNYAHGEGIIHRDIKPANILIETHTNRPIVSDFGLATAISGPEQDCSMAIGSPTYMAPEQILKEDLDGRTDIYATGIMLFEMLASNLPFPASITPGELIKIKSERKKPLFQERPSEMNPMLNEEMDKIVFRAISYDPEKRYATCEDFRKALVRYKDCHIEKALGGKIDATQNQ